MSIFLACDSVLEELARPVFLWCKSKSEELQKRQIQTAFSLFCCGGFKSFTHFSFGYIGFLQNLRELL